MSPKADLPGRPRLIVVDESREGGARLRELLDEAGFGVRAVSDGHAALLNAAADPPDLILIDCELPSGDGFETCRLLKMQERTRTVPVILLTGLATREHRLRGLAAACDGFVAKPVDAARLTGAVHSALAARSWSHGLDQPEAVLVGLSKALESKHDSTRGHCERVAELARGLAAGWGLPVGQQHDVWRAGLLLDIGKVGVPDELLRRPGALTPEETQLLRRHSETSYEICRPLAALQPLLGLIRGHHERMDGSGYPDGLRGDEISRALHCLIVADYFDALVSVRSYRPALTTEQAFGVLRLEAGLGRLRDEVVEMLAEIPVSSSATLAASGRAE